MSELHLAWDEVPVAAQVFVDEQISYVPFHVDVGRLFEELTGDPCSPDHFQVLPKEQEERKHY